MSESKPKVNPVKFVLLRIGIGLFFAVVSIDKLLEPYQNFLYVVQNYQIFPAFFEEIVARVLPWIELVLSLFLISGLWLKWVIRGFQLLVGGFILIVLQAIIRKLPIEYCGCFGGLFSLHLQNVILMDICLFLLIGMMGFYLKATSAFSLDEYFSEQNRS